MHWFPPKHIFANKFTTEQVKKNASDYEIVQEILIEYNQ